MTYARTSVHIYFPNFSTEATNLTYRIKFTLLKLCNDAKFVFDNYTDTPNGFPDNTYNLFNLATIGGTWTIC